MEERPGREALRRAAEGLEARFGDELRRRGGDLQVAGRMGVDWGSRTLLLSAVVEFDALFDHVDIEVATRRWFSRTWEEIRSVAEATELVTDVILGWIRDAGLIDERPPQET